MLPSLSQVWSTDFNPAKVTPFFTSLGQSNCSVITSRPFYRGSQTKTFHCSPILLVPRLGFFIPCSAGCILCLPKTHSSLHTCYKRARYCTASFPYPASQTEIRLIPHCCCQRGSYPTERKEEGAALGPPHLLLAPHPTAGKGHSSSPDLSTLSSPGHAAGLATREEAACSHFRHRVLRPPGHRRWAPPRHSTAAFPLLFGPGQ